MKQSLILLTATDIMAYQELNTFGLIHLSNIRSHIVQLKFWYNQFTDVNINRIHSFQVWKFLLEKASSKSHQVCKAYKQHKGQSKFPTKISPKLKN